MLSLDEAAGVGALGADISSDAPESPQDAKNRAAVSIAVVNSAALKAAVNRRALIRANGASGASGANGAKILPLPFLMDFINNSSDQIKLWHKSHWACSTT
jgi:hypothetical protein